MAFRGWILSLVLVTVGFSAEAEERASVRFEGSPLPVVLRQLQESGLKILFSSDLVRPDMVVAEEPRRSWPREILDEVLTPHGLCAEPGPAGVLLVVRAPAPGSITGLVRRSESGEPAAGARVIVLDTGRESLADPEGRFTIDLLPPGRYRVETNLTGFLVRQRDDVRVESGKATRLSLSLEVTPEIREEVVVHSTRPELRGDRPESRRWFRGDELTRSPEFARDALLPLARTPGVVATEGSGGLNVRGSDERDVKIVLDGLELFDPYHLQDRGGPISILDSENLQGIDLLDSAFPAQYGGHMGGVLEMASRAPADEPRTSVALASDEVGVASEGGIGSRAHWLVSGRRGNPTELLEGLGADPSYKPAYWDAFAKIDYDLADRTSLTVDVLAAHDFVDRDDGSPIHTVQEPGTFRSYHASSYAWLQLQHAFSPALLSQTMLSFGEVDGDRSGSTAQISAFDDSRKTRAVGFKQDWSLKRGSHFVRWGLEVKQLETRYEYDAIPVPDSQATNIAVGPRGRDQGVYISDEFQPWTPFRVAIGLRWDDQTYAPGQGAISPRLNVSYAPDDRTILRAGWGTFYQPQKIYELQVEDGITEFFPAERAEHRMLGIERRFGRGLVVVVEAYQKHMSDLHPRFENLFDPYGLLPEEGDDRVRIDAPSARAEGLELSVRGLERQKLGWHAGYGLARAEDRIDGSWVPRSWEQRHTVTAGLNFRPTPPWELMLAGTYHSGRPTTAWTTETQVLGDSSTQTVTVLDARNQARLPPYARLDFGVRRSLIMRGTTLSAFVNVTNLLDRGNVCCVDDSLLYGAPQYRYGLPRLVTYGVTWAF